MEGLSSFMGVHFGLGCSFVPERDWHVNDGSEMLSLGICFQLWFLPISYIGLNGRSVSCWFRRDRNSSFPLVSASDIQCSVLIFLWTQRNVSLVSFCLCTPLRLFYFYLKADKAVASKSVFLTRNWNEYCLWFSCTKVGTIIDICFTLVLRAQPLHL